EIRLARGGDDGGPGAEAHRPDHQVAGHGARVARAVRGVKVVSRRSPAPSIAAPVTALCSARLCELQRWRVREAGRAASFHARSVARTPGDWGGRGSGGPETAVWLGLIVGYAWSGRSLARLGWEHGRDSPEPASERPAERMVRAIGPTNPVEVVRA